MIYYTWSQVWSACRNLPDPMVVYANIYQVGKNAWKVILHLGDKQVQLINNHEDKLFKFEELSAILSGLPYLLNPVMVHLSNFYTDEASLLI